jgi:protein-S-isoprenylcysteine O-methyltransferase Ste14
MVDRAEVDRIETIIRLIEVALSIGRHVLQIFWIIFVITVALAIYNFVVGSIVGGIIASLFAIGDALFLAQIYNRRTKRRFQRSPMDNQVKKNYKETASA